MRHNELRWTTILILLSTVTVAHADHATEPEAAAPSISDIAPATEKAALSYPEKILRFARNRSSALRLGDERISGDDDSNQSRSLQPTAVRPKPAASEEGKVDTKVDRTLSALERMLQKEEQRLEARLEALSKKRSAALEKGDERILKQIETLEKQAVVDYERRIERLLSSVTKQVSNAPVSKSMGEPKPSGFPAWNLTKPTSVRQPTPAETERESAPPRRKLRLWPFR